MKNKFLNWGRQSFN